MVSTENKAQYTAISDSIAEVIGSINSEGKKKGLDKVILSKTIFNSRHNVSLTLYHQEHKYYAEREADILSQRIDGLPHFEDSGILLAYRQEIPYIVTEPIVPLSMVDRKKLSTAQKLHIIKQTATILDDLHRDGIIHHLVTPDSIVLAQGDEVINTKLRHFELSANFGYPNQDIENRLQKALRPIERLNAINNTGKTDQLFLGETAYWLFGGIYEYPIDPLGLDPDVWRSIRKAVNLKPSERYSCALEFATSLEDSCVKGGI